MDLGEFFDAVEAHEELCGVSVNSETGVVIVEHVPSKLCTSLPKEDIEKADWQLLEDIFTGKREPNVLYHITRIVGYYSRVENWNRSKLGEMKARIKGNYGVEGSRGTQAIQDSLDAVNQIQNG